MSDAVHPNEDALRSLVRDALQRDVAELTWLSAQLGLRRFARLTLAGDAAPHTLIARIDAPEDPAGRPEGVPPEPPLEPIRAVLEAHGLPVPRRFAADEAAGIELLEDMGDVTLQDAASDPARRLPLYTEACDWIARLQAVPPQPIAAFSRHMDAALIRYKATLFAEHALGLRGREATPAERDAVAVGFAHVAELCAAAPQRLAHRDYQSANLHVIPAAPEGHALRMIDLQGALLAPPEYDAVCLLRDSYVELAEDELETLCERVRQRVPDAPDRETFETRFDALTLTRKGKDLARFVYAAEARGDRRFLRYVPATVRSLHRAAARAAARNDAFAPLAELVHQLPESACAQ